jgi:hypoxanthine-guanine phosphoribosyltransferase
VAALGVAAIVMTLQGYLGGELVYRYGMDVRGRYRPLPIVGKTEHPHASTTL